MSHLVPSSTSFHDRRMKNLVAAALLALAAGAGCYASGYTTGYTGVSYVGVDYSTPPPAYVEADLYYEPRPGYTYVNGRYDWVGGQWVWRNGQYVADRPGHVYVQGYWDGNRWYDGRWEVQRAGYVYTDGYWDRRGSGHVWIGGRWEPERHDHVYVRGRWTNSGGVRTYDRGGWRPSARGPQIRDHRR